MTKALKAAQAYAQGRINTLSQAIAASGLTVREIEQGAGVSHKTAWRAMTAQGIQAYNYFKIEHFIMNYENRDQEAL